MINKFKNQLFQKIINKFQFQEIEPKVANIDCDWYEPVKLCFQRIYPFLSPQGYIVVDDYYDYGGCKKAVDEFLSNHHDLIVVKAQGNLIIQRQVS